MSNKQEKSSPIKKTLNYKKAVDANKSLKNVNNTKKVKGGSEEYKPVTVEEIPDLMKNKRWKIGAKLQEKWFEEDSYVAPPDQKKYKEYKHHDFKIVTMEWAWKFPRFRAKYKELIDTKNPDKDKPSIIIKGAKEALLNVLKRNKIDGVKKTKFDFIKDVTGKGNKYLGPKPKNDKTDKEYYQHENQIQYASFKITDHKKLDDMDAALADFSIYALVKGTCKLLNCKREYEVVEKDNMEKIVEKTKVPYDTLKAMSQNKHIFVDDQGPPSRAADGSKIYPGDIICLEADKGEELEITITHVGVYIRDSFDFNDKWYKRSQTLGSWSRESPYIDDSTGKIDQALKIIDVFDNYEEIQNKDYREYRNDKKRSNGKGMDFMVWSNVKVEPLNPPYKFRVKNE